MDDTDQLRRFLFEDYNVRGEWVRLRHSWQEILAHGDYPEVVQRQLGQALAAVALLAAPLKIHGALIIQAQGDGALRTLVTQATHDGGLRGLARHNADVADGDLATIYGAGHLLLTIRPEHGEPHQGVVELVGENLGQALENFFAQSEQLPTRLWLYADAEQAVGLFLQAMPDTAKLNRDAWEHVQALADTISDGELRRLDCETLLHRLFHAERVRLFAPEPLRFQCSCSAAKIAGTLVAMGQHEINGILAEQGEVRVVCEFCNRKYRFGQDDIAQLFLLHQTEPESATKH